MSIGPRLEFRQSQSLVMTPQLRQAIKLLQFSNLEVAAFVEEELERNPLLDRDERPETPPSGSDHRIEPAAPAVTETTDTADLIGAGTLPDAATSPNDGEHDGYEASGPADGMGGTAFDRGLSGGGGFDAEDGSLADRLSTRVTLREHLGEQLRLNIADPVDRLVGAHLIALLDPAGRVAVADERIAAALGLPCERVAAVRARLLGFDPCGMFALDLRQCLAAQLIDRNRFDPAMAAMLDNLELVAKREFRRLAAICEVDWDDILEMVAELRALDPKPGVGWDSAPLPQVIPDVLMRAAPNGDWLLELNPETMPRILVNEAYHARVCRGMAREDRGFMADKLATANWLVKSLHQRAQTILKVAAEIVRQQDGFFRHGVSHLRPLILRQIAEEVQLHESTVSRVTANKYLSTPRGTFELKYFFTTAIAGAGNAENHSAEAVRHRIRALIGAEGAADILSDDALVAILRKEGVDIARRTVAKYREALRIPSSVQRKREKSVPA